MNFLAHSLMGFDDEALIAGQFCGDFVRGRDLSQFPQAVERGIRMHRYLDIYTDNFPALLSARLEINNLPRRFTGIVVDVLFDHYLARNWSQVSEIPLDEHARNVDTALLKHQQALPEGLKRFAQLLKERKILENNIHLSAIEQTLQRLSMRSARFSVLALGEEELVSIREILDVNFEEFYPALLKEARHYLNENPLVQGMGDE